MRDVLVASGSGEQHRAVAEVCIRHHVSPIFNEARPLECPGSDASVGALGTWTGVFGGLALGLVVGMEVEFHGRI